MHEPIERGLEAYLEGRAAGAERDAMERHLTVCGECRAELALMREHRELLWTLRAPEQAGPAPGFYARVMERIEAQTSNSFWSIFLEPAFGRRLMLASLALFVLLGSAVWQASPAPGMDQANPMTIMAGSDLPVATGNDPGRDRSVVLTNLVSLNEGGPAVESLPISSD